MSHRGAISVGMWWCNTERAREEGYLVARLPGCQVARLPGCQVTLPVHPGLSSLLHISAGRVFGEHCEPFFDAVSDVLESGGHWRSNFQIDSRVLKKC